MQTRNFSLFLPLTLINPHCQREVPVFDSDRQVGHICTSGSASPTTSRHTHWHTLSLEMKGSSSQHTTLSFLHVGYFLRYVINYCWDLDCLDVDSRPTILSVLNCDTWTHCLGTDRQRSHLRIGLNVVWKKKTKTFYLFVFARINFPDTELDCLFYYCASFCFHWIRAAEVIIQYFDERQTKQDPPLNAPRQRLVRRYGLVAIRKPCTAAGSLTFQLWNLAHPSCKPPSDSIFNHFQNLWGSQNKSASLPSKVVVAVSARGDCCSEKPQRKTSKKKKKKKREP